MVLDVECVFRDWSSISSECQIPRDVDLGQVNLVSVASIQMSLKFPWGSSEIRKKIKISSNFLVVSIIKCKIFSWRIDFLFNISRGYQFRHQQNPILCKEKLSLTV